MKRTYICNLANVATILVDVFFGVFVPVSFHVVAPIHGIAFVDHDIVVVIVDDIDVVEDVTLQHLRGNMG